MNESPIVGQEPIKTPRMKLRKGAVERAVKQSIEKNGGTFLYINWKKRLVHTLTPSNKKQVISLPYMYA